MSQGNEDGALVRRARLGANLTQSALGEKLDVSQSLVSQWETGAQSPPSDLRQKLGALGLLEAPAPNDEDLESPIAKWLSEERIRRKLTPAALAEQSGLSPATIYNIESGRIANPQRRTIESLESVLGTQLPQLAAQVARAEATVADVGEFVDFDPYDFDYLPTVPGIYVLYDISERPVYVGQAGVIRDRIIKHEDRFWFKRPIVSTGLYVHVPDEALRRKLEAVLIRFLRSNAVLNVQHVRRQ
jgi:transcriptional regulator with XRE-family HTH domain